jgi:hypothetical protein
MKRSLLLAVFVLGIGCIIGAQEPRGPDRGNRPIGTWEQTAGDVKITLTITADRLHITAAGKDNKPLGLIDADYSVTKDSILYGIVTSVEEEKRTVTTSSAPVSASTPASLSPASGPPPALPLSESASRLGIDVDDLFSVRFRVDDDILTLKEPKAKTAGGRSGSFLKGRFKKKGEAGDRNFEEKTKEKRKDKEADKEFRRKSLLPQSQRSLKGDLAQLNLGKVFLLAPQINRDEVGSKVWAKGDGAMQLETTPLIASDCLKTPARLTVHWGEDMSGRGDFAEYYGTVQVQQENSQLTCQRLQLLFDRPLSFREDAPETKAVRIRALIGDKEVRIQNSIREKDDLERFFLAEGSAVTINTVDGEKLSRETCLSGPGTWRLFLTSTPKEGEPKMKRLVFVRFGKLMKASDRTKTTSFWGDVELLLVPSDDPQRKIDFEAVRKNCPKDSLYLRCDRLKMHMPRQGETGSLQMESNGRVVIRTPEYAGQSNTLQYDEAKDQIRLIGEPERMATLEKMARPEQQPEIIRGRKICFIRSTGQVWAEKEEFGGR